MEVKGKKIFVGLSGGVDSAVSAALLQQQGALVTGVFIKGWYPPGMPCTWRAERQDAMRVAAHLHIPFRTLDASTEYKQHVIDYLLAEYAAGRTPNPDVMCNREIKFGAFYRYAMAEGADAIATGHYCALHSLGGVGSVVRAKDAAKDQSYFLALVPRDILLKTVFPVGEIEKSDVRKLAKRFGIPVAEKRDSQGVCFLGSVSVKEFLAHELGNNAALLHTIGERVAGQYVVGKKDGKLVLENSLAPAADAGKHILFHSANWFSSPDTVTTAQYRYRGPKVAGRIVWTSDVHIFELSEPLGELPAPGQLIAFYRDTTLVGGAIIDQYV